MPSGTDETTAKKQGPTGPASSTSVPGAALIVSSASALSRGVWGLEQKAQERRISVSSPSGLKCRAAVPFLCASAPRLNMYPRRSGLAELFVLCEGTILADDDVKTARYQYDLLGRGTVYLDIIIYLFPFVSSRVSFSARLLSDVAASQVPSVAAAVVFPGSPSCRRRFWGSGRAWFGRAPRANNPVAGVAEETTRRARAHPEACSIIADREKRLSLIRRNIGRNPRPTRTRSGFEEDLVLEVVFWLVWLTLITTHLFWFHFALVLFRRPMLAHCPFFLSVLVFPPPRASVPALLSYARSMGSPGIAVLCRIAFLGTRIPRLRPLPRPELRKRP